MAFKTDDGMIQPCFIYTGWTNGVGVNFEWMRKWPRAALEATLDRLAALPTIARARDEIMAKDFAKRPTVPLTELNGDRVTTLTDAIDDLLTHPTEQLDDEPAT